MLGWAWCQFHRHFTAGGAPFDYIWIGHWAKLKPTSDCSQSLGHGYSPKNDFRAALVDWVENGKAPEVITGTHYETSKDGKSVPTFQRPLCKVCHISRTILNLILTCLVFTVSRPEQVQGQGQLERSLKLVLPGCSSQLLRLRVLRN